MRGILFSIFCLVVFIGLSCKSPSSSRSIPDISHIKLDDFTFERFDKKVFEIDTLNLEESYSNLLKQHPKITDLYFKRLLGFRFDNLDTFYNNIGELLKADKIKSLQQKVDQAYKNDGDIRKDLKEASRFLKHYFPQYQVPNFYTFITEFAYQTIIFPDGEKDGIGLGLDMYLMPELDYKEIDPKDPVFSDYLTRTYNRDHIARKAMELVVIDLIGESPGKRMIDQMIHNGKKCYILEQLLPTHPDTVITEYSNQDLNWLRNNELQIWDFFLEKKLMYETNHLKVNKYLNPSPHSPGMPQEAPGRTATFIGWQIVKAYMRKHPNTTLSELIALRDSQKLMELAKYKPKRR